MPNVNRLIFLVFALAAVLAARMSSYVVGTVTDRSGAVVPADYTAAADKDAIPCS
jgi:hypothetical protein